MTRRRMRWSRRRSPPSRCSTSSSAACRDFHFYTMNRADLAFAICHMIGIRGELEKAASPAAA